MIPIIGASWRRPRGPGSKSDGIPDHPVVHVSKRDAAAYCWSVKKRLPTEAEWEFAARGGLRSAEYPWGDTYQIGRTNLWQGPFPDRDAGVDGYNGTSPVQAFRPQNAYGMHDIIGNVWEWTNTVWRHEHHMDSRMGRAMYYGAGNVGFRCAVSKDLPPVKSKKTRATLFNSLLRHSEL